MRLANRQTVYHLGFFFFFFAHTTEGLGGITLPSAMIRLRVREMLELDERRRDTTVLRRGLRGKRGFLVPERKVSMSVPIGEKWRRQGNYLNSQSKTN